LVEGGKCETSELSHDVPDLNIGLRGSEAPSNHLHICELNARTAGMVPKGGLFSKATAAERDWRDKNVNVRKRKREEPKEGMARFAPMVHRRYGL